MDNARRLRADHKPFNVPEAVRLYWREGWSLTDLAAKYGLHHTNILRRFQRLGIKTRPKSDAGLLAARKFIRRGERNHAWKRGWWIDAQGYVVVCGHRRREHRVVAERVLGRPLELLEVVHHINGEKSDSRPENLFVCDRPTHAEIHRNGVVPSNLFNQEVKT